MRAHVDLGAALLVAHLVHELVDQVDPASAGREEILAHDRARDRGRVEPRTGVSDDDQHAACVIACHAALDLFRRVVAAAVLDRVGERLAQGELDLELAARGAAHLGHDRHHLGHDRRNRVDLARQRQVHLDQEVLALELAASHGLGPLGLLLRPDRRDQLLNPGTDRRIENRAKRDQAQ